MACLSISILDACRRVLQVGIHASRRRGIGLILGPCGREDQVGIYASRRRGIGLILGPCGREDQVGIYCTRRALIRASSLRCSTARAEDHAVANAAVVDSNLAIGAGLLSWPERLTGGLRHQQTVRRLQETFGRTAMLCAAITPKWLVAARRSRCPFGANRHRRPKWRCPMRNGPPFGGPWYRFTFDRPASSL